MCTKTHDNYTQCLCEEPSRTLDYDKSKICSILRGDYDENIYNTGKKVIYSGINRPFQVFKHVRGCYFNEPSVKPFLKITPEGRCQKRKIVFNSPIHGVRRLPKTSVECSKNIQTQTSSYEDLTNNPLNCHFTQRREEYERSKSSISSSKLISTRSSFTNKDFSYPSSFLSEFSSSDKLKDLECFRKDNYFDTHNVFESIPDHKCVHQFKINDRFLPEPINPDCYGISRCIICNKALETPRKGEEKVTLKKKIVKNDVANIKKRYEMKLKPVTVNIGTGKEVMKISVPYGMEEECLGKRRIPKKTLPFDSLALRHQKGVFMV